MRRISAWIYSWAVCGYLLAMLLFTRHGWRAMADWPEEE